MGALRIACNGLCTAARFHTAEERPGCLLGCHLLTALRSMSYPVRLLSFPVAWNVISLRAIFNDLLFKIAVQSDRLNIFLCLVYWMLFVMAFNLRRTHQGPGLNFEELTYGRIKMMTALCPTWPTMMCLGFRPQQLRLEAFRLPKPKLVFFYVAYLPNYHQNDWNRGSRLEIIH